MLIPSSVAKCCSVPMGEGEFYVVRSSITLTFISSTSLSMNSSKQCLRFTFGTKKCTMNFIHSAKVLIALQVP